MSLHDKEMPKGWHTIKSVLLKEIHTAANFHLCCLAVDALFHARLIGEGISKESEKWEEAPAKSPTPDREARLKYQSLVYSAMNLIDEPGDFRKGKGVTTENFLEKIKALKARGPGATTETLDMLQVAEELIVKAITHEDGIDGKDGSHVALRISELLFAHGRKSVWVEAGKKEPS